MNFSSNLFLFWFFPSFFILYFIIPGIKLKNIFIFLSSIVFYFLGEPLFGFAVLLSVLVNYFIGKLIHESSDEKSRKLALILGLVFDLGMLFVFKYLGFIISLINAISPINFPKTNISLPIGISFYTFQIIAYISDIYMNPGDDSCYQPNLVLLGEYIMMFPQLIAGPIVRYRSISGDLYSRSFSLNKIYSGLKRFIRGLGKKIIIANSLAVVADKAFSVPPNDAGAGFLLLGAISYTFQIFFDFSGYSDMALGMGKMMGFDFPENFDYPYVANSIRGFWKKWHMTLSSWFRDYVYIPLGGSKAGKSRTIFNLAIVWFLTGLWHGASLTFVLWGMLYFLLLIFERYIAIKTGKTIDKLLPPILSRLYTLFFVMLLWIIFRSDSIGAAFGYIGGMLSLTNRGIVSGQAFFYIKEYFLIYLIALLSSTRFFANLKRIQSLYLNKKTITALDNIFYIAVLFISIMHIAKGSYNPFIYFNF